MKVQLLSASVQLWNRLQAIKNYSCLPDSLLKALRELIFNRKAFFVSEGEMDLRVWVNLENKFDYLIYETRVDTRRHHVLKKIAFNKL